MEGIGCVICGLFGTGIGTTSYSDNIAAIGLTKVTKCAHHLYCLFDGLNCV